MKVHTNLKALLLDYEKEKDQMYNRPVGVDEDDLQFIHHYASHNRLKGNKKQKL